MTRRAVRRRCAILGVLHEHGPQFENELCILLRRRPGTLYPDLSTLEREGLIVGEWEKPSYTELFYDPELGGHKPRPRRMLYRIITDDEREKRRQVSRAVDQEIAERVAARTPPRRRIPILRPGRSAQ